MHQETELLVNAIEGLKQDPSYIKDYIFPVAITLFTTFLGAGVAYFVLKYQERIQIEKDKLNTANKWILRAEEIQSALIAIKHNYHDKLSDLPIQRVSAIPSIIIHDIKVDESFEDLSFIVPLFRPNSSNYPKWSQIPRIRSMFYNYNFLIELWNKRNELNQPIMEKVVNTYSDVGFADVNQEQILKCVNSADLVNLIDFTEKVVNSTDDILIEVDEFLTEFPIYVKDLIDTKALKKYGSILSYSNNDNKLLSALLERTPKADFKTVEKLFGLSSKELTERYETGY